MSRILVSFLVVLSTFLLLSISVSAQKAESSFPFGRNAVDVAGFPRAQDDDVVDVYLLEGVISYFVEYEKLFGKMHALHGAIGTRNHNSGFNATFEYWAPELFQAVFPHVDNPGPDCAVKFASHGIVSDEVGIDDKLWEAGGEEKIASMTGKQWNEFVDWTPSYNTSQPNYYLWTVTDHHSTVYIPQHTCFDFVWNGFAKMFELGVIFDHSKDTKRVLVYLYVEKDPIKIDPLSTEYKKSICNFYDVFQYRNETIFKEIAEIFLFFPDDKFVYAWADYYLLDPKFPYIGYHYEMTPLPGAHKK